MLGIKGSGFAAFRGWGGLGLSGADRRRRQAQFRFDQPEVEPRRQTFAFALDRRAPTLAGLIKLAFHRGEDGQVVLNQNAKPRVRLCGRPQEPGISRPRFSILAVPDKLAGIPVIGRKLAVAAVSPRRRETRPAGFRAFLRLLSVLRTLRHRRGAFREMKPSSIRACQDSSNVQFADRRTPPSHTRARRRQHPAVAKISFFPWDFECPRNNPAFPNLPFEIRDLRFDV